MAIQTSTARLEGDRAVRINKEGELSTADANLEATERQFCIHLVGDRTLQIFDGDELLKTVLRTTGKEVRKKHAKAS